ncbi:dihydrolipoamide acetyltransferase family protein [Paenibacillus filicis]|uniref:Dihydrolipoamide acetyltransferase component of pyruvate dehydrogenase complex n=1 Tax=Paenibacillus filicis TaxID=669464 RepID=A0ABU9DHE5_9BACL
MGDRTIGTEVKVPHLAESLVSATIGKWLKKPGDYIEQYDVLCELITEKITVEMPSPIEGTLVELLVPDGATAAVGEAICIIQERGTAAGQEPQDASLQQGAGGYAQAPAAVAATGGAAMSGRYSPAVLKLAAEHRIDLEQVPGTGLGGRITRKDVEAYAASGGTRPSAPAQAPSASVADTNRAVAQAAADEGVFIPNPPKMPVRSSGLHLSESPPLPNIEVEGQQFGRGEYLVDVTPIRNAIASKMKQSKSEIPHAWTMIEVDVTNLVMLRNKLKGEFMREEGINLTYLAFLLKAVVNAIKDYPIMNSVWATDKIIVKRDINISLAVGTEDFLVTPVIKKADQLNIAGLAREIDGLTKRARTGKLTLDEMQGGTFTVNNTGSFGSILSYPVINYPQAAILSFESIVKRPVVIQDMIAVRSMVNLCLSLDHRILDGIVCGRFLQRVKENLESFNQETKLY